MVIRGTTGPGYASETITKTSAKPVPKNVSEEPLTVLISLEVNHDNGMSQAEMPAIVAARSRARHYQFGQQL